jgi:hypothetical protein
LQFRQNRQRKAKKPKICNDIESRGGKIDDSPIHACPLDSFVPHKADRLAHEHESKASPSKNYDQCRYRYPAGDLEPFDWGEAYVEEEDGDFRKT